MSAITKKVAVTKAQVQEKYNVGDIISCHLWPKETTMEITGFEDLALVCKDKQGEKREFYNNLDYTIVHRGQLSLFGEVKNG